jgi:hypothetical protein
MNLRELAAADHRLIVEDVAGGFGRELRLIDPDGRQATVNGFWNDIGQNIDLNTGAMVSGRAAFARITRGALRAAGLGMPIADLAEDKKPWRLEWTDMGGNVKRFMITEVRADRSIDAVDCYVSEYE